jgi:polar amino acid transport system permease protein
VQSLIFGPVFAGFQELLDGAWVTIFLTLQAIVIGTFVATTCAWLRTSGPKPLKWAVMAYVEIIRNTPFLLQLFFFFFGLPSLGLRLTTLQTALLAMVVNLGAYATEIIRAGIEAIPHGQTEAGSALGLNKLQVFLLIILLPALQIVYPPLAAQYTMVLLGSSLASAISANELTSAANVMAAHNFRTLEVYIVVTFMYLVIVFVFRGIFAIVYNLVLARGRDQRMKVL